MEMNTSKPLQVRTDTAPKRKQLLKPSARSVRAAPTPAAAAVFPKSGTDVRGSAHRTGFRECGEGANSHVLPPLSGGDSGGGAAAPRLEKRTYSNTLPTGKNRITLRDYGNGLAEVGWAFISAVPPNKAARGQSLKQEQNQDRAARRAKSRLRQLILSANLTHLLTLTYRENVTDFNRASDDLNRYVRKIKAHLPDWLYVAVAEQQERGAWHWHIAVGGRQDVELLRTLWREIVGEGNIDVSAPKGTRKDQRLYLVKYLGKYLVKEFTTGDRTLNKHRFRASRNIQVPMQCFTVPPCIAGTVADYAIEKLKDAGGSVGFVWNGDGLLAGWACSWK